MKHYITTFKKSVARQTTIVLLGLGFVNMAITIAGPDIGLQSITGFTAVAMLVCFGLATVSGFMMASIPVPQGIEPVEVEERVQILMSDELKGRVLKDVEEAITNMDKQHKVALEKAVSVAVEAHTELADLKSRLRDIDLEKIYDHLEHIDSKVETVDEETTIDSVTQLQNGIENINKKLAQLDESVDTDRKTLDETVKNISDNVEDLDQAATDIKKQSNATFEKAEETADLLSDQSNTLQKKLDSIDVTNINALIEQLAQKSSKIDADGAGHSVEELKEAINDLNGALADLTDISSRQAEHIERKMLDLEENLEALKTTFAQTNMQVDQSMKQFQRFNES